MCSISGSVKENVKIAEMKILLVHCFDKTNKEYDEIAVINQRVLPTPRGGGT